MYNYETGYLYSNGSEVLDEDELCNELAPKMPHVDVTSLDSTDLRDIAIIFGWERLH